MVGPSAATNLIVADRSAISGRIQRSPGMGKGLVPHAAFEQAVKDWPHEHFTLRQGIMLIREHPDRQRT